MTERDHFVSLEMAAIGMEMVADWGCAAIAERIGALNARLAAGLATLDLALGNPDARLRAPNMLSLTFPAGIAGRLVERLAAAQIHVATRLGRLHISPHVYNDEADIDRCVAAMGRLARSAANTRSPPATGEGS